MVSPAQTNAALWNTAGLKPQWAAAAFELARISDRGDKDDAYAAVASATGLPRVLVQAIHYREAGASFRRSIQDGHPLQAGVSWIKDAIFQVHRQFPNGVRSGSPAAILDAAERWNGFGYRQRGLPSPYVWAWTTHQQPGKFIRDGAFDATVSDTQPGVAAWLLTSAEYTHLETSEQERKPVTDTSQPAHVQAADIFEDLLRQAEDALPEPYREVARLLVPILGSTLTTLSQTQGPLTPQRIVAAIFAAAAARL